MGTVSYFLTSLDPSSCLLNETIKRRYDFDEKIWKSRGQPISKESWLPSEAYNLNFPGVYPILNDRIAYVRGLGLK